MEKNAIQKYKHKFHRIKNKDLCNIQDIPPKIIILITPKNIPLSINFLEKSERGNRKAIIAFVNIIQMNISPIHHNLFDQFKANNNIAIAISGKRNIFLRRKVVCVMPARNRFDIVNLASFIESGFRVGLSLIYCGISFDQIGPYTILNGNFSEFFGNCGIATPPAESWGSMRVFFFVKS